MSRIVVLSTFFLNIPSANGICARNIVDELRKIGHEVEVVCYDKGDIDREQYKEHIFPISQSIINKKYSLLQKTLRMTKTVMGIAVTTLNSELVEKYYRRLVEINAKSRIDAIVAFFFPFEGVEAMAKFKKGTPDVKTIIYEVDSTGDGVSTSVIYNLYNIGFEKWLAEKYEISDTIVVMKSHEKYWREKFGKKFEDKLKIVDIPVLVEKQQHQHSEGNTAVTMLYSGLLERKYRSPSYLLSVLQGLNKRLDFEFRFYSKGDCEEEIAEAAKHIKSIKQYGYVMPEELESAICKTGFLVNIGNSVSQSVPSKLISYISYGKPIIHFSLQKDDICKEYLDRYPMSLVIESSENIGSAVDRIINFLNNTGGEPLSFEDIRKRYLFNDPRYSAEIISDCIHT